MKIAIDVDSTIWPAEEKYDEAALRLYGKPFFPPNEERDWYDSEELREHFGENFSEIFQIALNPRDVYARTLYPGAREVIRHWKEIGLGIHFLSHSYQPARMYSFLTPWLRQTFGNTIEVDVIPSHVDKVEMLPEIGAFGIIDDKVEILEAAVKAGYYAGTKLHPWNRRVVAQNASIVGFDSWYEFFSTGPPTLANTTRYTHR